MLLRIVFIYIFFHDYICFLSEGEAMAGVKHNRLIYKGTYLATKIYTGIVFKKKILRNEIKGKPGPFVVIANHECAMDFANLMGATRKMMTFVISESFQKTVSVSGLIKKMGVIAKKQFETTVSDMKKMKQVIKDGGILVLYPAGLMCADGRSTPIPEATYKFLKWLGVDIYMARTTGSYFVKPKWSKKTRRGRTVLDIYKLFDKEELMTLDDSVIRERALEALLFDAYRDQDEKKFKYKDCDDIEGLQNVLYACPHCGRDFSMAIRDKSEIYCKECGYSERSDEYGMLHKTSECGEEIRYVSDWSFGIKQKVEDKVNEGGFSISSECRIFMIDDEKHKFLPVGCGKVSIADNHISLVGTAREEQINISLSLVAFPSLPFMPGEYIELQHGDDAFRLYLADGARAQLFVWVTEAMHKTAVEALQNK